LTGTLNYFGSADSRLIERDFPGEQQVDFTIRKEVLWQSDTASDSEVNRKEVELILDFASNDPAIGYNQWPRFRGQKQESPGRQQGR
jgi:hypothetical protein